MNIPSIGLGTWQLRGAECKKVIQEALEIGYRHIDTAFAYENHQEIGEAIKGFDRSELFITSKILLEQVQEGQIKHSVEQLLNRALKELQLDYLDLFLIHWPDRRKPLEEIFAAIESLKGKKLRFAGVSNYTIHHLEDHLKKGLKVDANQVEFHPYLYQKQLLDFCQMQGIQLIAFRPFGKGKLLQEEPLLNEIGEKYGKTGAQIILKWLVQKKIAVVAKAASRKHLEENLQIFDFSLSAEDEQMIDGLNQDKRYCKTEWADFDY